MIAGKDFINRAHALWRVQHGTVAAVVRVLCSARSAVQRGRHDYRPAAHHERYRDQGRGAISVGQGPRHSGRYSGQGPDDEHVAGEPRLIWPCFTLKRPNLIGQTRAMMRFRPSELHLTYCAEPHARRSVDIVTPQPRLAARGLHSYLETRF